MFGILVDLIYVEKKYNLRWKCVVEILECVILKNGYYVMCIWCVVLKVKWNFNKGS